LALQLRDEQTLAASERVAADLFAHAVTHSGPVSSVHLRVTGLGNVTVMVDCGVGDATWERQPWAGTHHGPACSAVDALASASGMSLRVEDGGVPFNRIWAVVRSSTGADLTSCQ